MSYDVQTVEAMPVAQRQPSVIAVEHKAQIEALVDTAHKYPRNLTAFRNEALSAATADPETAMQMSYSVPRGGKAIEGASVRLAEICAMAYGNLRYGANVIDVGDTHITCRGYCFDMQKNIAVEREVKVRITDKSGRKYNEDMITVAGNAGCSKALRNAILTVIPKAYVDNIRKEAHRVAYGNAKSLSTMRDDAMKVFRGLGITDDRILHTLGRKGVLDVTSDDVATLRGMYTAIKDGELSVDEAFPEIVDEDADGGGEGAPKVKPAKNSASAKAKAKLETPEKQPEQAPEAKTQAETPIDTDAAEKRFNELVSEGVDPKEAHELVEKEFGQ
jgi:hypothetical protein